MAQALDFFLARQNGDSAAEVLLLPDRETLPYDVIAPQIELLSRRIDVLRRIGSQGRGILLCSIPCALHRLPPRSWLSGRSLILKQGQELPLQTLLKQLVDGGYRRVDVVREHGEFSLRGGIVDLFPPGTELPLRIEWFDDSVDSLRYFDPENQVSVRKIDGISLMPACEYPMDSAGRKQFLQCWRESFASEYDVSPLYKRIGEGHTEHGLEYYLPLFFEHCDTIFDYLPKQACVVTCGDSQESARSFLQEVEQRHAEQAHDRERPPLPPEQLYLSAAELEAACQRHASVELLPMEEAEQTAVADTEPMAIGPLPEFEPSAGLPQTVTALLQGCSDRRLLFAIDSGTLEERLRPLLDAETGRSVVDLAGWAEFCENSAVRVGICRAPISGGFMTAELALITRLELLGERPAPPPRKPRYGGGHALVEELQMLRPDDLIVHEDYGIGRYLGLKSLTVDDTEGEYIALEYAGGDRLYLPVQDLSLLRQYGSGMGTDVAIKLNSLGSNKWQRTREAAKQAALDTAAELLEIQARRAMHPGSRWEIPQTEYADFTAAFPFDETPDQHSAIADVLDDLSQPRPMDRLVCGDVGFGKTEVAMRAAFIAAWNGAQTLVLVPTTLLAQQHLESFRERFHGLPMRVEGLTRSTTKAQLETFAEALESGDIDILIATHRILYKKLPFKNLGLAVIDEEHRFGVRHKEELKALRRDVNLLSMTATPIPRTLHMALGQLRELSIMASPPDGRLPIRSFVAAWDSSLIRTALMRELHRGGQAYYIHHRIDSIERIARELQELLPQARIGVAHGRMPARALESVMADFQHHSIDLLLCTTIVESGLDVSNANTLVVGRADLLGLAELHQLRGRVGRGSRQAYAWMLVPGDPARLPKDTSERLRAITRLDALGSGFLLASSDLDIRGSGELLGKAQSGNLQQVGIGLYSEMLDQAVQDLGKDPDSTEGQTVPSAAASRVVVDLQLPALLPEQWVPDLNLRLVLYKRLSGMHRNSELQKFAHELRDRFGRLPEETENLLELAELRLRLLALGIDRLNADRRGGSLLFGETTEVAPRQLVALLHSEVRLPGYEQTRWKMNDERTLSFVFDQPEPEQRLTFAKQLISLFEG